MAKIHIQVCLEETNFFWLNEEKIGRRHKNLSITINEIIKNYQYLINTAERERKNQEINERKIKEAQEFKEAYRKQVIERD